MSSTIPTVPSSQAPKPQCSPPTVEEQCLKTFRACWLIDKSWLISFVASALRVTPSSAISWVEFMPQGHTHLVRSTLKLVPPTKALPIAKIKEVMFQFILEVLNDSAPSAAEFFKARKAKKPRARTRKHTVVGKQLVDMAVDSPPANADPPLPSTGNAVSPGSRTSTPVPGMGAGTGRDKGELCPRPSSEALGDQGTSSEVPRAYSSSDVVDASLAAAAVGFVTWRASAARAAPGPRSPWPTPSTTSMLGKRDALTPSPPPLSSPPPAAHTLIGRAPHDWKAWIQDHCARSGSHMCHVLPMDLEAAASFFPSPLPPPSAPSPVNPRALVDDSATWPCF